MKKNVSGLILLIAFTTVLFIGCNNPSSSNGSSSGSSGSGSSGTNFNNDISLFDDSEVDISTRVSRITLSDGTWKYACDAVDEYPNTTPLEMRSFLTLTVSNNGNNFKPTTMEIIIRKKIPEGTSDAEINEVIEETKNDDYFLGDVYIKGADVYREGNYLYIAKTYSQQEINQLYGSGHSTQLFNQIFYANHSSSIVKTNSERTKYKITVNERSGSERINATVWILKQ